MSKQDYQFNVKLGDIVVDRRGTIAVVKGIDILNGGNTLEVVLWPLYVGYVVRMLRRLLGLDIHYDVSVNSLEKIGSIVNAA